MVPQSAQACSSSLATESGELDTWAKSMIGIEVVVAMGWAPCCFPSECREQEDSHNWSHEYGKVRGMLGWHVETSCRCRARLARDDGSTFAGFVLQSASPKEARGWLVSCVHLAPPPIAS